MSETLLPPAPQDPTTSVLELDELWSFVLNKTNKCRVWIALCRDTRQVVADVIGERSAATCQKLWERTPTAYRPAQCSTGLSKGHS